MKKNTKLILILIAFIIIVLIGIVLAYPSLIHKKEKKEKIEYVSREQKIHVDTITIKDSSKYYYCNIEYPQVQELNNKNVEQKINQFFKQKYEQNKNENIKEMNNEGKEMEKEGGNSQWVMQSTDETHFKVFYPTPNIITFKFNNSSYGAGAAHPMSGSYTYNFNINNGNIIELKDLFKSNSKYLQIISRYCNKELHVKLKENSDDNWINEGSSPTKENYSCYTIKDDGILFTFGEYQVACYADGQQEVLIPYSELSEILNKDIIPYKNFTKVTHLTKH
ncbi:MAG: DUF3298 and DUF4163 domain-containing protein [FCB group bacterium]|jgi:flagellar basal body-associated protein FliL